jgi:hypothetical protein
MAQIGSGLQGSSRLALPAWQPCTVVLIGRIPPTGAIAFLPVAVVSVTACFANLTVAVPKLTTRHRSGTGTSSPGTVAIAPIPETATQYLNPFPLLHGTGGQQRRWRFPNASRPRLDHSAAEMADKSGLL